MYNAHQPPRGAAIPRARFIRTAIAVLVAAAAMLGSAIPREASTAEAATVPTGMTDSLVAGGLTNPTAMAMAPDGRIFVAQQGGALRVIKNGVLLSTPFLTVTVNSSGERGLLGVAIDPNFTANQHVYIYYTATTPAIHNRVSRFNANGDVAVAASEAILLELDNLSSATNHNGGALHFGTDGKLYIGVGDNAIGANAQSMSTLHGKMLRINFDGNIPSDNPFYATASGKYRAIWALGLRNPFSFSVQPGTGRMFINDVGQSAWEEINDGIAASNYGWPATEGATANPAYRSPVHAYGHGSSSTTGCAITGGAFYNPPTPQFHATYVGDYFFADYCSGWIRRYDPVSNTATGFATGISLPVDLLVSPNGKLYYLARGEGSVRVISDTTPPMASIAAPLANAIVNGSVPFTVSASDTVAFHKVRFWVGATYLGYDETAQYAKTWNTTAFQNGRHTLKIEALDRAGNSTIRTHVVTVKNPDTTPPSVSITAPANGATVAGTTTITATATDNLGVQKVRFYVDSTYLGYDSTAPFSMPWNSAAFPNGSHTVRAQAVDWLENVSEHTITVNVSNNALFSIDADPVAAGIQASRTASVGSNVNVDVVVDANVAWEGYQITLNYDDVRLDGVVPAPDQPWTAAPIAGVRGGNRFAFTTTPAFCTPSTHGPSRFLEDDAGAADWAMTCTEATSGTSHSGEGALVQFTFKCEAAGTASLTLGDVNNTFLLAADFSQYNDAQANATITCQ